MPDQITQAELRAVLDDDVEDRRHKRADKIRKRVKRGAAVEPGELEVVHDLVARAFTIREVTHA